MVESRTARSSLSIKSAHVLPPDTNSHGTMFGGKLMSMMDDIAAIAATRHARTVCVTASTDSVDFLRPITAGYAVSLEAFVTWAHRTSMEVFVKVIAEDLLSGKCEVCATAFLTFVAIGEDGKPTSVPTVVAESEQEKFLQSGAPERAERRLRRREESRRLAELFGAKLSF